jgi:hypothetical protein
MFEAQQILLTFDRSSLARAFLALAAGLFNFIVVFPLFGVEYLSHTYSNEQSFVAIARFLREHWPHTSWFSWWDLGMPLENAYFPVVPYAVAGLSVLTHWSESLTYHNILGFSFVVGPPGIVILVARLTGSAVSGFFAAFVFSCCSVSALVFPEIRVDLGSVWGSQRLRNMLYYGEGPHNIALALLPWLLVLLHSTLEKANKRRSTVSIVRSAAIACALISLGCLLNPFGTVTLLLCSVAMIWFTLSVSVLRLVVIAVSFGILIAGLCSFATSPTLLETIRQQSQFVGGDYRWGLMTLAAIVVISVIAILIRIFGARFNSGIAFSITVALAVALPVTLAYAYDVSIVPQPRRYHLDLEILLCVLLGTLLALIVNSAGAKAALAAMVMLVWSLCIPAQVYFASGLSQGLDIKQTYQYAVAQWAEENTQTGDRLFIGGDAGFLFNVFSTRLQCGNGHQPSTPNFQQAVGVYTVYTGTNAGERDAMISILWLKAFGAKAIFVPPDGTAPTIQPFVKPNKFDGILKRVPSFPSSREAGTLYFVGHKPHSLFRIVEPDAVVHRVPAHGLDVVDLRGFVESIERNADQQVAVTELHPSEWKVRATHMTGKILHVNFNHDAGWEATANGLPFKVEKDALGLMYLRPQCESCEITLQHHDGRLRSVFKAISYFVWAALLALIAIPGQIIKMVWFVIRRSFYSNSATVDTSHT